MKILKIVQTPARFYPYTGGVEKYVLDLSQELVSQGHRVKVICANEPNSTISNIYGIEVKRLNYVGKITNTNITLNLFFTLIKENYDIIHTHFPTPWSADISMVVSTLLRKPLILTYHNDVIKSGLSGVLADIYNKTLLQLILRKAEKIIDTQPSYINKSKYLQKYKEKIVTIPNGVNTKLYKDEKIKKIKSQILFLSVLDKYHRYKGLDYLIKAIKLVKLRNPKVKLIVGGNGELIKEYKLLANKLGVANNVEFKGFIENNELIKLYNQSELFVLPSINIQEGFGIVLLESLSCGTPVIATDLVGIANEIKLHKCGLVVASKDVNQLASAIIKITKSKKITTIMKKNTKKLIRKYDWKNLAIEIKNIYMDAV